MSLSLPLVGHFIIRFASDHYWSCCIAQ